MSQVEASGFNMVVVDNTSDKRASWCQAVVKAAGFRPTEAASAEEARRILGSTCVDVLVVDLFLSTWSEGTEKAEDSEGLELIRECRELYPDSRIIAITSRLGGSAEIGALALDAGADDFMSSAWSHIYIDALLEQKVRIYLRQLRNKRQLSAI